MSVIDTLITDRTQADVDRVSALAEKGFSGMTPAELSEYLAGMKGSYNASDLNRVNEAMTYLAQRLTGYGYTVTLLAMKTWSRSDIPTPAQMSDYLENVSRLRGIVSLPANTPSVPADTEGMTYEEANNIEKILAQIETSLFRMSAVFRHCGAAICGFEGSVIL